MAKLVNKICKKRPITKTTKPTESALVLVLVLVLALALNWPMIIYGSQLTCGAGFRNQSAHHKRKRYHRYGKEIEQKEVDNEVCLDEKIESENPAGCDQDNGGDDVHRRVRNKPGDPEDRIL